VKVLQDDCDMLAHFAAFCWVAKLKDDPTLFPPHRYIARYIMFWRPRYMLKIGWKRGKQTHLALLKSVIKSDL
jgi:hypothetical protein